jgi:hypothetical protein
LGFGRVRNAFSTPRRNRSSAPGSSSILGNCFPAIRGGYHMRDDLLDALASVEWAAAQLPTLENRFKLWGESGAFQLVGDDSHPETGKHFIKLRVTEPFPRIANAEVGAIINSTRSSLDLLAVAVAKRYSVLHWNSMYFPIAADAAEFARGGYKGHELIKALPADASQIFESLKPYAGGNDALVALHALDIMRKHQRLIDVRIVPSGGVFVSPGMGFPPVWPDFKDGAIVAWTPIGAPQGQLQVALDITFDEASLLPNKPVVSALGELAALAQDIIMRFD